MGTKNGKIADGRSGGDNEEIYAKVKRAQVVVDGGAGSCLLKQVI